MSQYPPPIIKTERRRPNYGAVVLLLIVAVGASYLGIRGLFASSVNAAAQPGSVSDLPTQTPIPQPTATATPNRLLETASSFQIDEARARAEGAALQNTIVSAAATSDEIRRQDAHALAMDATSTAIAAQMVAQGEAISLTQSIDVERARVEIKALRDRENLYIGGRIVLYFVIAIGALVIAGLVVYAVVTAWRQAGQPPQAEMAEYIPPPEPQEIETKNGDNLGYPLKTSSVTRDELRLIAQAKKSRQITSRAVERLKMSSERWSVVSGELANAGYFVTSGNIRLRVFTTDDGENLLRDYSPPLPRRLNPPKTCTPARTKAHNGQFAQWRTIGQLTHKGK